MNKNEFLEELNRHLLILEDEEQQDIWRSTPSILI